MSSFSFRCIKWSTVTVIILNIICLTVLMLFLILAIDVVGKGATQQVEVQTHNHKQTEALKEGFTILKTAFGVSTVIAICIHLLGVIGVVKNHFCLVMTYGAIMVLSTILCLLPCFKLTPLFVLILVLNSLAATISLWLAIQIKRVRSTEDQGVVISYTQSETGTQHAHCQQVSYEQKQEAGSLRMEQLKCPGTIARSQSYNPKV